MNKAHKKTLNYLFYKCKFTIKIAHKIMAAYGEKVMNKPRPNWKMSGMTEKEKKTYGALHYKEIAEHIQANWQTFMDFYGTVKDNYQRNRKFKYKTGNDNDHITEALQYTNGSADDF